MPFWTTMVWPGGPRWSIVHSKDSAADPAWELTRFCAMSFAGDQLLMSMCPFRFVFVDVFVGVQCIGGRLVIKRLVIKRFLQSLFINNCRYYTLLFDAPMFTG